MKIYAYIISRLMYPFVRGQVMDQLVKMARQNLDSKTNEYLGRDIHSPDTVPDIKKMSILIPARAGKIYGGRKARIEFRLGTHTMENLHKKGFGRLEGSTVDLVVAIPEQLISTEE